VLSFCFAFQRREFICSALSSRLENISEDAQKLFCSRLLRAQTLTVSWKSPWENLAETNLAARGAASFSEQIVKWWSLLDTARTHFESGAS
jgi:hypothetical protein